MAGSNASWFDDLPEDFEESVRIDRDERDHREQAIRSYHMTADSQRFVHDFLKRMGGQADDMRTGSNYWLYGYYGSGKSHLLTVLDGLLDTEWLEGQQDDVWTALVSASDDERIEQLYRDWRAVHTDFEIIPVSINLLKYQGQKQRSLSEIVLSHAHQNPHLTGVDDGISEGLSPQIEVAYFEKWFRTTDAWANRQTRAAAVLDGISKSTTQYEWQSDELWKDIQRYGALANVVLPELFEEQNGTRDGYSDLQPSDIDPAAVVSRLEELRTDRESELGKPVKLVLLLDEVSLFIGTDFEYLTELQTLAENVDDIGDGDIQLVATAQAKIEDVQPRFAAHGADFSIVKDRFPHRYQLPSKHVGDIAKRRLLEKTPHGTTAVQTVLDEASIKPVESLVYSGTKQNTKPPLDEIDHQELLEFYPFLPYHAPLFLEILFNLRRKASDPAKSIFSGTARAILAIMHNLLHSWAENENTTHVISLVDFYELIKPELREILTQDMHVIEGSNVSRGIVDDVDDGELTEFDLDVAKAVLLLRHVHEIIPLSEGNIAVSVMSDLNGRSWTSTQNRVGESLDRLQKFIRPTNDESRARYRFATQEERTIYEDTETNEANPDWDAILQALDEHLWERVVQDLSLPGSVPYGETETEYPVRYDFRLDGTDFETTIENEGGLDVGVAIQGVRPDHSPERKDEETLYWSIDTDGLGDLQNHLVEWWALRDAISTQNAPPDVERDLAQRAKTARSKLVSAMERGSYAVKDRTEIRSLSKAIQTTVDIAYPDDFHPMMLQVTEERLQELVDLSAEEPLPTWAHTIQVPSADPSETKGRQTIQRNVLALTGRQLKDRADGLNIITVLDEIVSEKPFYANARPALRAIIWGFCRTGRLVPIDEEGNTVANSSLLDRDQLATTRLKLLPRVPIGKLLEEGGFKETTETVADGLINLQQTNQRLRSAIVGLREDVELTADTDVHSEAISSLLNAFIEELNEQAQASSDRLTIAKSQGDGLDEAIEQTNEAQGWLDEVTDVWNRRRTSLYRLDAQLVAGSDQFAWVDEETHAAVSDQRKMITNFDGPWWITDGWHTLIEKTTTDLSTRLQRAWATSNDQQGRSTFGRDHDRGRCRARRVRRVSDRT